MAVKEVVLPDIGPVTLQKRRSNRSLRISITPVGKVRISLPVWATYRQAISFANSRKIWIAKHKPEIQPIAQSMRVGKAHQLTFVLKPNAARSSSRVKGNEIVVYVPGGYGIEDTTVQNIAHRAAIKALKQEATQLLPSRLADLARRYDFEYNAIFIKRLSSRWGSCDNHGNITLNCFLMQLPWQLIDYVLLHELVHTKVMAHGERFWDELGKYVDNLPAIRKEIRARRPSLVL